jgi:hypothetical protein
MEELARLQQQDRVALSSMLVSLNGAKNALRRDQCGDWTIRGSRGHVRACGKRFSVYVTTQSARAWTFAKRALDFCQLSQDGDDEGILTLDRLPSSAEAEIMRQYIGLRQTRDVPPERASALHPLQA